MPAPEPPPLRLGLLRLSDSAPVLLAEASGGFAEAGLDVRIVVEPSWANVADKLAYGLLDAAVMLPPLALAAAAGLRGMPAGLTVPMGLSRGGNSVVLCHDADAAIRGVEGPLATARALLAWLRAQPARPALAVVHRFSTHNLLLRHWLAAVGGVPEADWSTVVVPPEQVVGELAAGRIAGFCAGAPWGDVAEAQGAGRVLLGTSAIWPHHPEKCLVLSDRWRAGNPARAALLLRALLAAGRRADTPETAPHLATLLAGIGIAAPRAAVLRGLPGGAGLERIAFHRGAAWFPWPAHAAWFLGQMRRWGWLDPATDTAALARQVYRPDLLREAALGEGLPWPPETMPESSATLPDPLADAPRQAQ